MLLSYFLLGMAQQGYGTAGGYQNMGPTPPGGMMDSAASVSMPNQPGFNGPYQGSVPQGQAMGGMMGPQGQTAAGYMTPQHAGQTQFPPTSGLVVTMLITRLTMTFSVTVTLILFILIHNHLFI